MADMTGIQDKAKSFWKKPEGKVGMVMLWVLGGLAGLGLVFNVNAILGFLIALTTNLLHLGLMVGLLFGILMVVTNKRFQATVFYLFRTVMRMFTGFVIELDPIAILRTYIDEMEKNLSDMDEQISKLKGAIRGVRNKISDYMRRANEEMAKAEAAKKRGIKTQLTLHTRQAARLKKGLNKFKTLEQKLDMMYRVLRKMYENCKVMKLDTENEVDMQADEWSAIQKASSAMNSAMKLIKGDKDKRAIFEEAMDFMATDIANKLGEMEHFMEMSADIMDNIDLENDMFDEKGLKMLEKWEQKQDSWLLGEDKGTLVKQSRDEKDDALEAQIEASSNVRKEYNELFQL